MGVVILFLFLLFLVAISFSPNIYRMYLAISQAIFTQIKA